MFGSTRKCVKQLTGHLTIGVLKKERAAMVAAVPAQKHQIESFKALGSLFIISRHVDLVSTGTIQAQANKVTSTLAGWVAEKPW